MSSLTIGGGAIAPAVSVGGDGGDIFGVVGAGLIVAGAAIYGAGWLAWKTGKFVYDMSVAAVNFVHNDLENYMAEKAQEKEAAVSAYNNMLQMCSELLADLGPNSPVDPLNAGRISLEIQEIMESCKTDDYEQLVHNTNAAYIKLNRIIREEKELSKKASEPKSLYSGQSLADLMDDMQIALAVASVTETVVKNAYAADPDEFERSKLQGALGEVSNRILNAVNYVAVISAKYGLSESDSKWFHSLFNGIENDVARLNKASVSNDELKRGVRRLKEIMERYDMFAPDIDRELSKRIQLYKVYEEAARALGEPIKPIKAYRTLEDVEQALKCLDERSQRAEKCATLYQTLGKEAYMSLAWDKELEALGYSVYTRKKVVDMINSKPERVRIDGVEIPCYKWNGEDFTQIYSLGEECGLQVIVHKDGKVSMQSIALTDNEEKVKSRQYMHCRQIKLLCERLRENWFISYDYNELADGDEIVKAADWAASNDGMWSKESLLDDEYAADRRKDESGNTNVIHSEQ